MADLLRHGGAYDAFGEWIEVTKSAPCTMSCIAQSYEQRLMYEIIPLVERYDQVYLLSWLHDGVTLFFGDLTERDGQLASIRKAVDKLASELGILTVPEEEPLDVEDTRSAAEAYINSLRAA